MARPLTDLQRQVLRAMAELETQRGRAHTANEIGQRAGAKQVFASRGNYRAMGAAQQIIPVLTTLRKRSLVRFGPREDGLSGTAYAMTEAGEEVLARSEPDRRPADEDAASRQWERFDAR